MREEVNPALRVESVYAGYGGSLVLHGVSATVGHGEVVAVIGPNGSGKSTLMKSIGGAIRIRSGNIILDDADVTQTPVEQLARRGMGYVPQTEDVFDDLTVRENLLIGGYLLQRSERKERLAEMLDAYPLLGRISSRRVRKISGGERKLTAIARALMNRPSVLLLDEPTAGLAPQLARDLLAGEIKRLSSSGVAVLLVEQRAVAALESADWAYVLRNGRCSHSCAAHELLSGGKMGELFLSGVESNGAERPSK